MFYVGGGGGDDDDDDDDDDIIIISIIEIKCYTVVNETRTLQKNRLSVNDIRSSSHYNSNTAFVLKSPILLRFLSFKQIYTAL